MPPRSLQFRTDVLTRTDDDLDSIFNKDVKTRLSEAQFTLQILPELKVKRSIILQRVDDYVCTTTLQMK